MHTKLFLCLIGCALLSSCVTPSFNHRLKAEHRTLNKYIAQRDYPRAHQQAVLIHDLINEHDPTFTTHQKERDKLNPLIQQLKRQSQVSRSVWMLIDHLHPQNPKPHHKFGRWLNSKFEPDDYRSALNLLAPTDPVHHVFKTRRPPISVEYPIWLTTQAQWFAWNHQHNRTLKGLAQYRHMRQLYEHQKQLNTPHKALKPTYDRLKFLSQNIFYKDKQPYQNVQVKKQIIDWAKEVQAKEGSQATREYLQFIATTLNKMPMSHRTALAHIARTAIALGHTSFARGLFPKNLNAVPKSLWATDLKTMATLGLYDQLDWLSIRKIKGRPLHTQLWTLNHIAKTQHKMGHPGFAQYTIRILTAYTFPQHHPGKVIQNMALLDYYAFIKNKTKTHEIIQHWQQALRAETKLPKCTDTTTNMGYQIATHPTLLKHHRTAYKSFINMLYHCTQTNHVRPTQLAIAWLRLHPNRTFSAAQHLLPEPSRFFRDLATQKPWKGPSPDATVKQMLAALPTTRAQDRQTIAGLVRWCQRDKPCLKRLLNPPIYKNLHTQWIQIVLESHNDPTLIYDLPDTFPPFKRALLLNNLQKTRGHHSGWRNAIEDAKDLKSMAKQAQFDITTLVMQRQCAKITKAQTLDAAQTPKGWDLEIHRLTIACLLQKQPHISLLLALSPKNSVTQDIALAAIAPTLDSKRHSPKVKAILTEIASHIRPQ